MLYRLFKFAHDNGTTIQMAGECLDASPEELQDALRFRLAVGYDEKTHTYMVDYKANIKACLDRLESMN